MAAVAPKRPEKWLVAVRRMDGRADRRTDKTFGGAATKNCTKLSYTVVSNPVCAAKTGFCPPEWMRGPRVESQAQDVWSIGIVIHMMLSLGRNPFIGEGGGKRAASSHRRYGFLRALRLARSDRTDAFLLRARCSTRCFFVFIHEPRMT